MILAQDLGAVDVGVLARKDRQRQIAHPVGQDHARVPAGVLEQGPTALQRHRPNARQAPGAATAVAIQARSFSIAGLCGRPRGQVSQ